MTLVGRGTHHQAWQPSSIFGTNMVEEEIGSHKFSSVFHMHVVALFHSTTKNVINVNWFVSATP